MPEDPTPIDLAVERAERKRKQAAPQLQAVEVSVLPKAIAVPADGQLPFAVHAQWAEVAAAHPWVLLFEPKVNAWHPVLLPVGQWRITSQSTQPTRPALWLPGGPANA